MSKALKIYQLLYKAFGPQRWWPADTPFEVCVGAILTQSTNWRNVEKAIINLKRANCLSPEAIDESRKTRVEKLIRPAGYYKQKTRKLKAFVGHLIKRHGSLKRMFSQPVKSLREELLGIHGIGPETADSIILYAAGKPSFVVDAYTKRVGHRLPLFKTAKYDEVKAYFEKNLPKSVKLYNEYHALVVELAKTYCKKKPLCEKCPLNLICSDAINRVTT